VIKDFVEVFVDAPLDVCAQRDPKGLYRKAREGSIKDLTGPQDSYEPPLRPEGIVYTAEETPQESVERILGMLIELGYLTPPVS
jgi:adenylylsulfate kinase-like enzyme